ncbi:MAG: aldehyde dehydrogenase family protein [Pseudomonadota bacterium]
MLIGGELRAATNGATFPNINPFTEEVIGVTADGTREDFLMGIAAARRAFDDTDWSVNASFRARCLRQLHDALIRRIDRIRPLLVTEVGTAVWLTRDTLLDVPIARLLDYARIAETYPYEVEIDELDFRGAASRRWVRREAIGVAAIIVPWNGPWGASLGKIGAALAAGDTVVLKPSPDAPWAGSILGAASLETDLPPGVLNVVTSADNLMGEVLTTDPRIDFIGFTGSAANGRRVAEVAARDMKRVLLELGGKSAYVVLPSADVEREAATAARLICGNAGQGCVARSRLLLPRDRYEAGVAAAARAMAEVKVGDPSDPSNFMGPLISAHHRDRVMSYIEKAKAEGARLVHGGGRPAHLPRGYFVEPTLFADVKRGDTIAQEEIFGPVLAAIAYDDVEDALSIANDSIYGLSATVAAATDDEALAFARRLRTGTVGVNGGVWMHMDAPFGGYKQSGVGRQFGVQGFETFLETKLMAAPSGKPAKSLAWGEPDRS